MTVVSEPSPIFADNRLYHSGRGGAGNYHTLKETVLPQPPNTINPQQQPQRSFFGGRGGAGNVHAPGERTMFSFDEELERDRLFHEHHAPVYSVGRGGAGNMVPNDAISTRSHYSHRSSSSAASSAAHSERSTFSTKRLSSGADKVLGKLTHAISS
jgi:hypothetical protein